MRIAVNARHLIKSRLEGIGMVTHEVMKRISLQHSEDRLDYFFDRKTDPVFIHGPNVHGHILLPPTRLPFLLKYWLELPVSRQLKRLKSDVFFSPDGFVPLHCQVPKVIMIHDAAFLRHPTHLIPRNRRYYEKWMPLFIREADHIITVSEFSKKELIDLYGITEEKISVVYNGVGDEFRPLPDNEQQEVRDRYFSGRPYFFYLGAIHPRKNILTLVRAFERFKESATSDYALVISGRPSWYTREVFKAVEMSPWRNEIYLTGFVEEDLAHSFMASATALVYPSRYEGFGLPVIEAMASGTPVICSLAASMPEVAGDAALYFDPGSHEQLKEQMERVTDQEVRKQMIPRGIQRAKAFTWDEASEKTYAILKQFART